MKDGKAIGLMKRIKRLVGIFVGTILLAVSLCGSLPVLATQGAESKQGVVTGAEVNVRSGRGTSYGIVGRLKKGDSVYILSTTPMGAYTWYGIGRDVYATQVWGYIRSDYVTLVSGEGDAKFESFLTAQGFPESYKLYLRMLHGKYPNWVFRAQHVNAAYPWSAVIQAESAVGKNLVHRNYPNFVNKADVDGSGNQIGRDGSSWYAASSAAVAYYMDPRNFLTDPTIFMFESLSFDNSNHTLDGIKAVLSGTFMAGNSQYGADGRTWSYAEIFFAAAEQSQVSPYHLASRARQEQGVNGTPLSYGTVPGWEGYYNFYNVSAVNNSEGSASQNGARYAAGSGSYLRPWNNQYLSIAGGAQFLGSGYIGRGQDTLYTQKFNVTNATSGLFSHQYMTNIMAPASESVTIKAAYERAGLLQHGLVFEIPVYAGMPDELAKKPDGSETTPPPSQPPSSPPPVAEDPYIGSTTFFIQNDVVAGLSEGMTAERLLAGITVTGGTVKAVDAANQEISSGAKVSTGHRIYFLNQAGALVKEYQILLYGDVDGDASITIMDLLRIQKHLLDTTKLANSYLAAADTSKNGTVGIEDLLQVQKHLLQTTPIKQR